MINSGRPLAVDLFAGVGGMSLGFEQAGFDVACAVEYDPVHAAAHKFNFPDTAVINGDVSTVTGAEIRARSGIARRRVSVVFGGSPCQGFSMIGKRSMDDPRNSLVRHFMRIVVELEADYFVFENVKGLTVGKHKAFLDEIIEGFAECGYDLISPYQVLNAAWFGVPQDRWRLFLVGCRRGLKVPTYPSAQTSPALARKPLNGLPVGPTVGDALFDLPDAEDFEILNSSDKVETDLGAASGYSAVLRGLVDDPSDFAHPREFPSGILTSSTRSGHTELTRTRFAATKPGTVEPTSRFLRLNPLGVCNTLRAGTGSERGGFTAARPIHPVHARCITVREMARLHSYPDWFRFNWTKWHGAREVGNSVPPRLARAVASSVIKAMGHVPKRPETKVSPGDESLLYMDAGSSSKYFQNA
ncbi:DNA cytosine methyltransferase [Pararhizobium sp. BT-229]|uniref:DNA cytosine methyltransferase n=1 Tax=Pararhizobium sp. BT-229 TaxID=2986923 RepID=UPI0021F79857|nr:DNA cytosine methyltransferase [Pararhizobium sp. BT-229]MCV9963592.1 DNA cytosine methyltransferase [Pararhizobium sp. BT-229]